MNIKIRIGDGKWGDRGERSSKREKHNHFSVICYLVLRYLIYNLGQLLFLVVLFTITTLLTLSDNFLKFHILMIYAQLCQWHFITDII